MLGMFFETQLFISTHISLFCFPQVVKKQTSGEVGSWKVICWQLESQLFQKYCYQKLLKSGNPSSYNR